MNDPNTSLIPVYLFFFCIAALLFVKAKNWWEARQVSNIVTYTDSEIYRGREEDVGTVVPATMPWRGLPAPTPKPSLVVDDTRIDANFRWLVRDALHVLVAGFTGSGKTSLCRGIVIAAAEIGKVFVIDTHGNEAKWGIPRSAIRGVGSNFDDAIAAFLEVEEERIARYEIFSHLTPGEEHSFPRLTVIVEEFPELVVKAKERKVNISSPMLTLVQGGREVNIHIVSVAQDTNAATMGTTGRARSLRNMTQVVLGVQAAEKLGRTFTDGEYLAAVQRNGIAWTELSTSFIPQLVKRPIPASSIWRQETGEEFVEDTVNQRAARLRELVPEIASTDLMFILGTTEIAPLG